MHNSPRLTCKLVGDIVQKRPDFSVQAGSEPIERTLVIDVWRVEKVDGSRVFLTGETFGITGWALSDHIISVESGVEYFSRQIRERPGDGFAYVMRARIWRDQGVFDRAMADASEAIRVQPGCAIAYEARAINGLEKREVDNALADCNEALRINPRLASAYYTRGVFWIFKHDCKRAIDDFRAAITA